MAEEGRPRGPPAIFVVGLVAILGGAGLLWLQAHARGSLLAHDLSRFQAGAGAFLFSAGLVSLLMGTALVWGFSCLHLLAPSARRP